MWKLIQEAQRIPAGIETKVLSDISQANSQKHTTKKTPKRQTVRCEADRIPTGLMEDFPAEISQDRKPRLIQSATCKKNNMSTNNNNRPGKAIAQKREINKIFPNINKNGGNSS